MVILENRRRYVHTYMYVCIYVYVHMYLAGLLSSEMIKTNSYEGFEKIEEWYFVFY